MARIPQLDRLITERTQAETSITGILDEIGEDRDISDAEMIQVRAARERIEQLDGQIEPLQALQDRFDAHGETVRNITPTVTEQRQPSAGPADGRLTITPREVTYASAGEFMVDLVRSLDVPRDHAASVDAAQRVAAALGRAVGDIAPGDHLTTADTPGLLPVSILGPILTDLDGARPLIGLIGAKDLGGIPGATFNRPAITKHHDQGTGKQTAEKAEGQGGEVKIGGIPFAKESFLRWTNISMQVIDWTSPGVWDVLLQEFLNEYALDTEIDAETKLLAGVTQSEAVPSDDYVGWVNAFYAAQTKIVAASGNRRRSVLRSPDTILCSLDMDASIGALLDIAAATAQKVEGTPLQRFGGILAKTPRYMLPGLPNGTVLFGRAKSFEFYEQRKGLLQQVEPKVMGIEVAYGGYAASGHTDATLFCKVTA